MSDQGSNRGRISFFKTASNGSLYVTAGKTSHEVTKSKPPHIDVDDSETKDSALTPSGLWDQTATRLINVQRSEKKLPLNPSVYDYEYLYDSDIYDFVYQRIVLRC